MHRSPKYFLQSQYILFIHYDLILMKKIEFVTFYGIHIGKWECSFRCQKNS